MLGGARRSTIVVSAATAPAPNSRSLEESHCADRGRPPTMLPTGVRPEMRANLAAMNLWQGLHVVGVNRAAMTVLRP